MTVDFGTHATVNQVASTLVNFDEMKIPEHDVDASLSHDIRKSVDQKDAFTQMRSFAEQSRGRGTRQGKLWWIWSNVDPLHDASV